MRDIYSHFSHSAKRLAEFKHFQHFTSTEPHKILKPAQTRWLSLHQCVVRVLEQWSALEAYFEQAAQKERLIATQNVLSALKNPIFKLYYQFLSFVLPKFTTFNKLFQSETPNIHFLINYLVSTYKAFLSCYLSAQYIRSTTIDKIEPGHVSNFVPLTSMNMGVDVAHFLVANSSNTSANMKSEIQGFLQHVQKFYIEAALQIQQRFPINDDTLKSLIVLNPDIINSTSANEITTLATKFPNIIPHSELGQLDDEWRQLQFMDTSDLPDFTGKRKDVATFWGSVSRIVDTSDNKRYPILSKLMKSMLSLPHSNADVERIFSQVVLVKTKHRNKLKTGTLDAILTAKECIPSSCVQLQPTSSMYRRMNSEIYISESSDSESEH